MAFNYFPITGERLDRCKNVWDGLVNRRPFGRAAICYSGGLPDAEKVLKEIPPVDEIPLMGTAARNEVWDKEIRKQVHSLHLKAYSAYSDDTYPALNIPGGIYGQSQGLAEILGGLLLPHPAEKDLYHPVPFIDNSSDVDNIKVRRVEHCLYGKSIEFAKYAHEAAGGQLSVRNPVITGPMDTANYVLGTTKLMAWVYDEPKALHKLLHIITEVLIEVIGKLQNAVCGMLCPEDTYCVNHGFCICSEMRGLVSTDVYNEFEAPYLRQIGEACGLYAIHSCGTWERTIPSVLNDPNLMLLNFQCREMDIKKVFDLTKGGISLSVQKSMNLDERYTWNNDEAFYKYMACSIPEPVPIEIRIDDIEAYISFVKEFKESNWTIFMLP